MPWEPKRIRIDSINVGKRFRKDMGDLAELNKRCKERGFTSPIIVTPEKGGGYKLLAGYRRMVARRDHGGESMIAAMVIEKCSGLDALLVERDENYRKDYNPAEMAELGMAIEEALGGSKQGKRKDLELPQNFGEVEKGKETAEVASELAGFGNPETYRQAKKVVNEAAPETVQAMANGDISVSDAAAIAEFNHPAQRKAVADVAAGKAKTALAAAGPKPGKPLFDQRAVDDLIAKLVRSFDLCGGVYGKNSNHHHDCIAAMDTVMTAWRRWQVAIK